MNQSEIEQVWQTELRKHFPEVLVRKSPPYPIPAEESELMYSVYMVPDERMLEFSAYMLNEVWKLKEYRNFPDIYLGDHSVTNTRTYYPRIWEEAQREKRVGVARRKPSNSRKSPPQRSAVRGRHKKSLTANAS